MGNSSERNKQRAFCRDRSLENLMNDPDQYKKDVFERKCLNLIKVIGTKKREKEGEQINSDKREDAMKIIEGKIKEEESKLNKINELQTKKNYSFNKFQKLLKGFSQKDKSLERQVETSLPKQKNLTNISENGQINKSQEGLKPIMYKFHWQKFMEQKENLLKKKINEYSATQFQQRPVNNQPELESLKQEVNSFLTPKQKYGLIATTSQEDESDLRNKLKVKSIKKNNFLCDSKLALKPIEAENEQQQQINSTFKNELDTIIRSKKEQNIEQLNKNKNNNKQVTHFTDFNNKDLRKENAKSSSPLNKKDQPDADIDISSRRPLTTYQMNEEDNDLCTSSLKTTQGFFAERGAKRNLVALEKYEMGEILGKGSYATVKKGRDLVSGREVAIKIYEKYRLIDHNKRNNVKRETIILQKSQHKNIIKLIETIDSKFYIHIVMEYVGSQSLGHFLKSQQQYRISDHLTKIIFKQIVEAVEYLHAKDIAHRDLKLENILYSEQTKQVKIIDFGFATMAKTDQKLNMFCGTGSYMSPEIIQQKEYLGKPSDIWSMGIILFVFLHGRFPFKGQDDSDLFKKIISIDYVLGKDIGEGGKKLIKSILKSNPLERPTAKEILLDDWLNDV